eukprot:CAMPEP_0173200108 /NCGR_PEP_ID=MMETSP1141-20130122/17610_1 /TAXON_ID=483371 /ORGANISM="non described non described, Strain CCMP2298" /LENGTH=41 /DNA_ID= /DNA_START= /DNA_END= /DNA_ORIENTATION=
MHRAQNCAVPQQCIRKWRGDDRRTAVGDHKDAGADAGVRQV